MRCPFCGRAMEQGAVQSQRAILFNTNPRKGVFWRVFQEGEETISQHNWTTPTCLAWRCRHCKKIVLDYGAEIP